MYQELSLRHEEASDERKHQRSELRGDPPVLVAEPSAMPHLSMSSALTSPSFLA